MHKRRLYPKVNAEEKINFKNSGIVLSSLLTTHITTKISEDRYLSSPPKASKSHGKQTFKGQTHESTKMPKSYNMNSARRGLKVIHYEINTAQTNLEKEPCKDVASMEGVFTCEK